MDKEQRVIFFWVDDLANWYFLKLAEEKYLKNDVCVEDQDPNIVDYLEFYNIHKYFENNIFLNEWGQTTKEEYQNKVKKLMEEFYKFFSGINENNILLYLESLEEEYEYQYQKDFWDLLAKLKIYEKINTELLLKILEKYSHHIAFILENERLVSHFNQTITQFLLRYQEAWGLYIKYLDWEEHNLYFPDSLTNEQKESIILNYFENSPNSKLWEFEYILNLKRISPKVKLKAKELYQKEIQKLFKENTIQYWFQVQLSDNQEVIIEDSVKDGSITSISYSKKYFDTIDFINKPLTIFYDVFEYINIQGLITLVSRENEITIFEKISPHWNKWDYKTSMIFKMKEILSFVQLQLLEGYLKAKGLSIEDIINNFTKNVLQKIPGFHNLDFEIYEGELSFWRKLSILIPSLELLIKQYNCFVKEKKIDFDLINMGEYSIPYSDIPSLLEHKYFYILDDKLKQLMYYFYSDQSWLFYIESVENTYKNFYELIKNEDLKMTDFQEYQTTVLQKIIEDGALYIDEMECIRIKDPILVFILWELYQQEVLSYYAYSDEIQKRILDLEKQGGLISKEILLSEGECDYFDYYLNRKKFTNWPEIRNKIHGYKYSGENEEYRDYLIVLKLTILLLLKMEWELEIFSKES